MIVTPKQLLSQLVKNKQIATIEADKLEVASLQKSLSIVDYLYQFSQIPRIEIIKARA